MNKNNDLMPLFWMLLIVILIITLKSISSGATFDPSNTIDWLGGLIK